MKLVLRHRGFEVRRTGGGHLVVLDPQDSAADRAELVTLLAESGALDALFFPNMTEARAAIDGYIAAGMVRPRG